MGFRIYVDDERRKPDDFDAYVNSNSQLEDLLYELHRAGVVVETISFDHDNMHGPNFIMGLTSLAVSNYWPEELVFHTANLVAHERMVQFAQKYAPETTFVDPRFFWPRHLG